MILTPVPLNADAFAPFGQVAHRPAAGARVEVGPAQNLRPAVPACLRWTVARRTALPLHVTQMERHRFSSQSFIPLGDMEWLLLVAPDAAGAPDMAQARAFLADGTQAITYAPGTWHHPLAALGDGAGFAVLTFLDGSTDDEEFVAVGDPIEVRQGKDRTEA